MQTLHTLINTDNKPLALTIGNFDGVHIGHQAMLDRLVKNAQIHQLQPAAMTFSPHAKALFDSCDNYLISSTEEKANILQQHHIQRLFQIPFNRQFAQISANDFLDKLQRQLQIKYLLVGADFRFGHQGKGDWHYLEQYCRQAGIITEQMPTVDFHGERVSSSRIRQQIRCATSPTEFQHIGELLGRPLRYRGMVTKGKQLGRTIDFPTANVQLPLTRLLPSGVFVVAAHIHTNEHATESYKRVLYGMCNIGTNPTVETQGIRKIEVHLFDFNANLYGKILTIEPLAKIRDEQSFSSLTHLVSQLHQDKKDSLAIIQQINSL